MKIYAILNRQPGINMVSEKSLAAFLLLNTAFYVGLFSFGEVKVGIQSMIAFNIPVTVCHVLLLTLDTNLSSC